jgi:hypothetical protein
MTADVERPGPAGLRSRREQKRQAGLGRVKNVAFNAEPSWPGRVHIDRLIGVQVDEPQLEGTGDQLASVAKGERLFAIAQLVRAKREGTYLASGEDLIFARGQLLLQRLVRRRRWSEQSQEGERQEQADAFHG